MPILSVMGVSLPVLIESLTIDLDAVGSMKRNARGWLVVDRRSLKRAISFVLAPKNLDEAMMYRALITGEGEFWVGSSTYGSKGFQISGTGGGTNAGGGNPILTNGVWRTTVGQTLIIPGSQTFYNQAAVLFNQTGLGGVFGSTVVGWRRDDAAGTYRAFAWSWRQNDTAPTIKREALGTSGGVGTLGTPQAYTGTETLAVSGSNLTVTAPSTISWSNLQVLPWYLKAAQLDALITGRNTVARTVGDLPRINLGSDLWPADNLYPTIGTQESVLVVVGELESLAVMPTMQGGVFDKTFTGMAGKFTEV